MRRQYLLHQLAGCGEKMQAKSNTASQGSVHQGMPRSIGGPIPAGRASCKRSTCFCRSDANTDELKDVRSLEHAFANQNVDPRLLQLARQSRHFLFAPLVPYIFRPAQR